MGDPEGLVHVGVEARRPAGRRRPGRWPSRRGRSAGSRASSTPGHSSASRSATGAIDHRSSTAPVGPPEVRADRDPGAALEQPLEGRQAGPDAEVVGDPVARPSASLERDVVVGPDEDPPAPSRGDPRGGAARPAAARRAAAHRPHHRPPRAAGHRALLTTWTRSTSRLEYPHSLSYQPWTFTRVWPRRRGWRPGEARVEDARGRVARRCPRTRSGPRCSRAPGRAGPTGRRPGTRR